MSKQPIYVVDTNILVDYPNIIPTTNPDDQSKNPTIDLNGAHLVIPTAVIRELSKFKKEEYTSRGKSARMVLSKLREIVERRKDDEVTEDDVAMIFGQEEETDEWPFYKLAMPIKLDENGMMLSILPVRQGFKDSLPFQPAETDMDGQIILATLSAMKYCEKGQKVTLITNDNGLAIRACVRGVECTRYGYTRGDVYTGRRDIVLMDGDIFYDFWYDNEIKRVDFEEIFPDERPLVANEFVVMTLDDPRKYPNDFREEDFSHIARYDAKLDALVKLKYFRQFPVPPQNAGQAIYAEILMDPDISAIICSGPAGSGKTFMATIYGYEACQHGDFIGVTVVPCEHASNIGALPGDLEEKIDPSVRPLKNALRNYLLQHDKELRKNLKNYKKFGATDKPSKNTYHGDNREMECDNGKCRILEKVNDRVENVWKNWFDSVPIEHARGRDFSYELAIYDEFQDQNRSQADTLIKRIGTEGKIIITGDVRQIHAPYLDENNNGLTYASDLLLNNPMVAQMHFNEDEVVRHPLVRIIAERQA